AQVVEAGVGVGEEVPDDDQDGAADRYDGPLGAAAAGDGPVALAQEGVGPAGGRGGLPEHAGQLRVAVAGGALALGLACGLLDTRGEAGPGGQMARGGETTHVYPDLGDDRAGGGAADATDLIQPVGRRRERDDQLLELLVQLGDVSVQPIPPAQHPGQQEPVMVGETPVKASSRTRCLARIRPRASSASTLGSRSPATSASSIARPETPKLSEATTLSLMWASTRQPAPRAGSRRCAPPPDRRGSGPGPAADGSPVAGRSWAAASAARRPYKATPRPAGRSWAAPAGA